MEKTTKIELKPFILYQDDIEELHNLLNDFNLKITYTDNNNAVENELVYESLKEICNDLNDREVTNIEISCYDTPLQLNIYKMSASLTLNNKAKPEHKCIAEQIKNICNRHPWKLKRFTESFFAYMIPSLFFAIAAICSNLAKLGYIHTYYGYVSFVSAFLLSIIVIYQITTLREKGFCKIRFWKESKRPKNHMAGFCKSTLIEIAKICLGVIIGYFLK